MVVLDSDVVFSAAADSATFTGNFGGGFISLGGGNDSITFSGAAVTGTPLVLTTLTLLFVDGQNTVVFASDAVLCSNELRCWSLTWQPSMELMQHLSTVVHGWTHQLQHVVRQRSIVPRRRRITDVFSGDIHSVPLESASGVVAGRFLLLRSHLQRCRYCLLLEQHSWYRHHCLRCCSLR